MKINGLQPQDIYKSFTKASVHGDDSAVTGKKTTAEVSADRVEISSESVGLNEARNLVQQSGIANTNASQVNASQESDRNEKIEALKQQVESGDYNVSSKDVANSILTGKYFDSRA